MRYPVYLYAQQSQVLGEHRVHCCHCEITVSFEGLQRLWEALYGLEIGQIKLGHALGEASLISNGPKFCCLNRKSRCNATTFYWCIILEIMKYVTFLGLSKNVTCFSLPFLSHLTTILSCASPSLMLTFTDRENKICHHYGTVHKQPSMMFFNSNSVAAGTVGITAFIAHIRNCGKDLL